MSPRPKRSRGWSATHEASTPSSRSRSRHARAVACSSNVLTVSHPSRRGSPMETGGSVDLADLRKRGQGTPEAYGSGRADGGGRPDRGTSAPRRPPFLARLYSALMRRPRSSGLSAIRVRFTRTPSGRGTRRGGGAEAKRLGRSTWAVRVLPVVIQRQHAVLGITGIYLEGSTAARSPTRSIIARLSSQQTGLPLSSQALRTESPPNPGAVDAARDEAGSTDSALDA
jgi:hypothetical protein